MIDRTCGQLNCSLPEKFDRIYIMLLNYILKIRSNKFYICVADSLMKFNIKKIFISNLLNQPESSKLK